MTLLDAPPVPAIELPPSPRPASPRPPRSEVVETLLVLPAVLWWALPLTHATGGRDPRSLAVELVLLLVAAAAVRPWRRLSPVVAGLGALVGLCAIAVCALAPTGWSGADDASAYAAAGLALPVAAAWARTPVRRQALAAVVVLAGLDQLTRALLPWWGGRDPGVRLVGTFYWHNPFAAYLLPAALLGLALAVWRVRPVQAAGWVAAPLCVAGVVLSTSRATLAVLVVGWLAVGAASALQVGDRARRCGRWAAASALAAATTWVLPGPPLFDHRVGALAGTAARSTGGETLAANGGYRVEFWREAWASFTHHPLVGSGYHGLIAASRPLVPDAWAASNYAHDGYLQALSDGGVLLAVPFLGAVALVGLLAVRRLWSALRGRETEPVVVVAAVALLGGLAHSTVDFDWSHPSVLLQTALLGGLVVAGDAGRTAPASAAPAHRTRTGLRGLVVLLVLLSGATGAAGAAALDHGRDRVAQAQLAPAADQPDLLAAAARGQLAPDLAGRRLLGLALAPGSTVDAEQRRVALTATRRAAGLDELLRLDRARLQAVDGQRDAAAATAAALLPRTAARPALTAGEALLLDSVGRGGEARALALDAVRRDLLAGHAPAAASVVDALGVLLPGTPDSTCARAGLVAARAGRPQPACVAALGTGGPR